jgi:hypothetical protein
MVLVNPGRKPGANDLFKMDFIRIISMGFLLEILHGN